MSNEAIRAPAAPQRVAVMALTDEEIEGLSPGIRSVVLELNALGFETSDSGDGSAFRDGMECAFEEPMVVVVCRDPNKLIRGSIALRDYLRVFRPYMKGVSVEASYSPIDGIASVLLYGDDLALPQPRSERGEKACS